MSENHGSGAESGESTLAHRSRALLASATRGVLCTLLAGEGTPYASLVDLLPLDDGDVAMYLSALAEHRRNLDADARASVLVAPSTREANALALPRVTLVGRAERVEAREDLTVRYVASHPEAEMYIGFPDFAFYRLRVEKARYIGGFGAMGWIDDGSYRSAGG